MPAKSDLADSDLVADQLRMDDLISNFSLAPSQCDQVPHFNIHASPTIQNPPKTSPHRVNSGGSEVIGLDFDLPVVNPIAAHTLSSQSNRN